VTSRRRRELARALAAAFLAGAWSERSMARRGRVAVEPSRGWMLPLVRGVRAAYHRPPLDRPRELAAFVERLLEALLRRPPEGIEPPRVRRVYVFEPAIVRLRWPIPAIVTPGELAERFELSPGQLEWLADVRGLERTVDARRLRNYDYDWRPRASGPPRLIERPKRRLKEVQRAILRDVLDAIPPHDAAHGFRPGRSAITNASVHAGRRVVMRFDLEDFFASIRAGRVYGVFRNAGYPEAVAHALAGLCTNVVPRSLDVADPALARRLATPHLPQGAPTSPALANLCAFTLDRRLARLARSFGARYTRYADDLTFSGGRRLLDGAPRLRAGVARVVREEGFALRRDKSSLTTRAGRQRVCGIVVNEHPNVARPEYDRLRALLHEARWRGPAAANRLGREEFAAHVLGRIAWVEALNPRRGAKLRRQYELVSW
jgi:hypothetical protein